MNVITETQYWCRFCNSQENLFIYIMKSSNMNTTSIFTICDICKKELIKVLEEMETLK